MMYCKYINQIIQDIPLKKKVFVAVFLFLMVTMFLAIIPSQSPSSASWHSIKDFILLFRYEYFHNIIFLILLGAFSGSNDWILLRRFTHRYQIASYKIWLVFTVTGIWTTMVILASSLYTNIVRILIIPNLDNYSAPSIYAEEPIREGTTLYFIYTYFCVTALIGLLYVVLNLFINNRLLSTVILIIIIIFDQLKVGILSSLFYKSEFVSPTSTFFILVAVGVLSINTIQYLVNKKDFYVRDDQ